MDDLGFIKGVGIGKVHTIRHKIVPAIISKAIAESPTNNEVGEWVMYNVMMFGTGIHDDLLKWAIDSGIDTHGELARLVSNIPQPIPPCVGCPADYVEPLTMAIALVVANRAKLA